MNPHELVEDYVKNLNATTADHRPSGVHARSFERQPSVATVHSSAIPTGWVTFIW